MIRLFDRHKIRKQTELAGLWDFSTLAEEGSIPSEYQFKLPVPGCWEQHPDFLKYRGIGAFRKMIETYKKQNLRFEFKGVSHTADVYFDGTHIAHHYTAYTPFSAVVCDVEGGSHELVVIADNRFSEESALHIGNDYYTYGGITRPVAFETVPEAFIEMVEFTPFIDKDTWNAKVKVYVRNLSDKTLKIGAGARLENSEFYLGSVEVEGKAQGTLIKSLEFKNVQSWSNEFPNLYLFETQLFNEAGLAIDDLVERVGFRIISINGEELNLNGKPLKLKGFNRHEDFAIVGCSVPFQLMVKDLELVKQTGANSIRTCHYPNEELFLDLCDEYGIYVWEENHARGLSIERMLNPHFDAQCEDCNREMVQNHINHPSIVIWGILNECASHTEEGRKKYKMQYDQIRQMDSSRPLTSATCQHFQDLCLEYADIVSLNIYSGWYNEEQIDKFYTRYYDWIQENGGKSKPIIISEFGAAAIYGFRDPARPKWSEERQCDILEECLEFYLSRPEIVGTLIWQFCDCRVTEENGWYKTRARTRNNKGVVDEYRRPKMAFETVKKCFKT